MAQSQDSDLVDVQSINPHILVDIRYATSNNFVGRPVYSCAKCFLRRKVALKLDTIQKQLEKINLGLKLWDGYRPLSVQKIFWDLMPDPRYVAPPEEGSRHNRGAAIDLTLVENIMRAQGFVPIPTEWWHFDDEEGEKYPIEDRALEDLIK
jgi:zinc D-Ala-D-Ala dipeptidase